MPFDIALRDNGSNAFDISLSASSAQTLQAPVVAAVPDPSIVQVQKKTYGSTADNTSHTITFDSAPTQGNVLIAVVTANDGTINTPSGWTLVVAVTDFVRSAIFTKVAGASEPSGVTFTIGNTESFSGVIMEYSGLTGSTDQSGSATAQGGGGTIATPSVSTTSARQLLVAVAGFRKEGGTVTITGWNNSFTEDSEVASANAADVNMGTSVGLREVDATGSYSSTATVSGSSIDHDVAIIAGFVASAAAVRVYPPSVTQSDPALQPPLVGDTASVYVPTIAPGSVSVQPPLVGNVATLYAPTVLPGALSLQPPVVGTTASLYSPTVSTGPVSVQPPLAGTTASLYAPTVTPGPVSVIPPLVGSPAGVYAPTVATGAATIQPPVTGSSASVYPPVLSSGPVTLQPPVVGISAQAYSPSVSVGPVSVLPPLVGSPATVYAPIISTGSLIIQPPLVGSPADVAPPVVAPGAVVVLPTLAGSPAVVYTPAVTAGPVAVQPPLVGSSAQAYPPVVSEAPDVVFGVWDGLAWVTGAPHVYDNSSTWQPADRVWRKGVSGWE